MICLRSYQRLSSTLLFVFVLLVSAGTVVVWLEHRRWVSRWSAAEEALRQLSPLEGAAAEAELKGWRQKVADAAQAVASHEVELIENASKATGLDGTNPIASRAAAYFTLVRHIEQQTEAARRAGVRHRADEPFGFASYRHSGPEPSLTSEVEAQRRVIEHCLDLLWKTAPPRFHGVQRTRPLLPDGRASTEGASADFFVASPGSARPGIDHGGPLILVRVQFEGSTQHLRDFIEAVSAGRPALSIERVDVEPVEAGAESARRTTSGPAAEPAFPLTSRFSVTLGQTAPSGTSQEQPRWAVKR